jgi:hypothetical protein
MAITMKITRSQLRQIIKEGLSKGVASESVRIGRHLHNIPTSSLSAVGGDFTKLAEKIKKEQNSVFVDITLAYLDQAVDRADQKYGGQASGTHHETDMIKSRHSEVLSEDMQSQIAVAIRPFLDFLSTKGIYISDGV